MNSTFEKHLKNVTFEQDILKLETLEDKIEFCKKFLKDNDALPVKLPSSFEGLEDRWYAPAGLQRGTIQSNKTKKIHAKATVRRESIPEHKKLAEDFARKDICDHLMSEILLSGYIDWVETIDTYNDSKIISATLRITK